MSVSNKIAVTLDDELIALFRRLTAPTGIPASEMIRKLILAHVHELYEVAWFFDQLHEESPIWHSAQHLIDNFGPGSLIEDIKRLDPSHTTMQERYSEIFGKPRGFDQSRGD